MRSFKLAVIAAGLLGLVFVGACTPKQSTPTSQSTIVVGDPGPGAVVCHKVIVKGADTCMGVPPIVMDFARRENLQISCLKHTTITMTSTSNGGNSYPTWTVKFVTDDPTVTYLGMALDNGELITDTTTSFVGITAASRLALFIKVTPKSPAPVSTAPPGRGC